MDNGGVLLITGLSASSLGTGIKQVYTKESGREAGSRAGFRQVCVLEKRRLVAISMPFCRNPEKSRQVPDFYYGLKNRLYEFLISSTSSPL